MADYENYKIVDAEQLDADLSGLAKAIHTKAETSGGLVFPDGFISAVDGIQKGIIPTGTINITQNVSNMDITYGKTLNVNVPVPTEYVNASLLQSDIHYFDSPKKTGNSTVSSSWYSFTPNFKPKVILFSPSEYNNGDIARISSSINTVIGSLWVDPNILPYTRYYMKGWFLTTGSTTKVNSGSNGIGARYDEATNRIFMYSKGSTVYGLQAGSNAQSAVSGFYMIQYWG